MRERTTIPQPVAVETAKPDQARTVRFMEKMHAREIFGTPESSKEFLDSLNYDEFKKWLTLINGLERRVPRSQLSQPSDSYVCRETNDDYPKITYLPPNRIFREDFLESAFTKSQSISDPEIAGLTLGLSINAIHYFEDGNGRIARMAYALLKRGYNGSEEDQNYYSQLLENIKGRKVLDPNPAATMLQERIRTEMLYAGAEFAGYTDQLGDQIPKYITGGYSGVQSPRNLMVNSQVSDEGRDHLYDILENHGMTTVSLVYTFGPEQVKDYIKKSPLETHSFIDGDQFIPTLAMKDIYKWRLTSEAAIMNYVTEIINIADRSDVADIVASYR